VLKSELYRYCTVYTDYVSDTLTMSVYVSVYVLYTLTMSVYVSVYVLYTLTMTM